METKYLVVLVTAKDNDEAQKISKALLDKRRPPALTSSLTQFNLLVAG